MEALGTQFYAQKGLQAGNPGPHNPLLPQGIAPDEAASSDGKELQNKPSSSASYQGSRPAFLTSNTLVGLGAWSSQVCNPQGHSQQESDNTSKQALASLDARTPIDIASTINLASQDGTSMRKENTQRVISAQQSDDHQAATETKQTNLPPAGTTSTQLSFREHGRKQSADCDIVPPPKGVAGSFTQTRDQLLQTESLPRHLEAVQNQSQVSTGPPSDAVGISIANKGFFARSRYRWFRRDKRQIEPKYDERVVEGAQLETWNINPTVRLTESGFKRFLVVSFIALEDKEILQYLLSDRQNSKSTVWQRYKALSAEERDALDDDILSRRARRHGHTGDAVLLSIRFGTMEPLQRKYDPIKGRSIRVILRINQNPTDEEENARATGSDFPAEPLDDLLDLSVLLSRAPMRGSALALPINWPRIRAGLADKEPPQLDLDDLLRGLGKTSLGAWESVPLRPASVHMEVMDGLEYNPFRNARRMRSKVPSGSRMTTLSVEDSMRDRLSLEAGPRSEDSQDMTIFSGIALSTLDVSGGEMIAMPSVDAPSVAGAKDVVSELLAEFTTLYD